ncbi:hypothetical protein BZL30_0657 [Mycobacterium kansasii]|uniref:Uncharacterized protein n=1 Tax=Mycobacterium kansasii TaxID=1768 RepID=A0A1V3XUE4_MYCKA|nr:hypothetical protein BZL30_0657 [Mycobacterium kansasii]
MTSRFTERSLRMASSAEAPRLFSSMIATSCSVMSSGTAIAATRPQ